MADSSEPPNKQRTVVVGVLWNEAGEVLLCKMKPDRGVFPDQWGLPGGGMHAGETTIEALERELEEELGLRVSHIEPAFFKDDYFRKLFPNRNLIPMFIIFLVFNCQVQSSPIQLNEEFSEYRWVKPGDLNTLDINDVTLDTLTKAASYYQRSRADLL